ncbi:RelA/SpoT domain-containing protein [Pantoea stewartii]|uniref:RelA/SpoT domain-containing protein n=1 Tax=Pantoea stewartii TaxID=66269 RepID=UPI00067BB104|nr:RelA/SpoT domain-containing protein [Pantoea stewartii]
MDNEIKISKDLKVEEFLINNNLTEAEFSNSKIKWDDLLKIGISHAESYGYLKETAVMLSSVFQQVNEVHSVRWRVKDPEHLMAKIIRKRNDKNEKYKDICDSNYTKIVTDLIGIRVLHLFKKDWRPIHEFITSMCKLSEKPVVYIRKGDESKSDEYDSEDCEVKVHKAGYRSAHYITTTRPMKDDIFTEIQVRTIFEEGWSEIDHRVRYPNFSDSELLNYFLMIFNRFSGSADEMGSFVLSLRESIELMELSKSEITKIENEKAESLKKIDELIIKLSSEQKKAGKASSELTELRKEINFLKMNESTNIRKNLTHSMDLSTSDYLRSRFEKEIPADGKPPYYIDAKINKKLSSLLNSSYSNQHKMILEALGSNTLWKSIELDDAIKSMNLLNNPQNDIESNKVKNVSLNIEKSNSKKKPKD